MAETISVTRTVGDTLTPLSVLLIDSADDPIPLNGATVKFWMKNAGGSYVVEANTANITCEPTQSFTVNATTDRVKCVAHGYAEGQQVELTTDGLLPGGLATLTRYYISDPSPNDFLLDSRPGSEPSDFRLDRPSGTLVDITDAGSGNHAVHAIGHAQYDFQASEVSVAGTYSACFRVESGGEVDTYPGGDVEFDIVLLTKP